MLTYLIFVSLIAACLGGCLGVIGGLLRLLLAIVCMTIALVFFCFSVGLSGLSTLLVCCAAVVCLNLGWLLMVIVLNGPKAFHLLWEQFFPAHK